MSITRRSLLLSGAVIGAALAGSNSLAMAADQEITLGVVGVLSGPAAQWGPEAAIKPMQNAWVANGSKVMDQVSQAICIRSSLAKPWPSTVTRAYLVPQPPAPYGRM